MVTSTEGWLSIMIVTALLISSLTISGKTDKLVTDNQPFRTGVHALHVGH